VELDVRVSVKGFNLDADLDGKYSFNQLAFMSTEIIQAVAPQVLREEQAKGFDKNPLIYVDNKLNKPLSSVKPFGKVEYVSREVEFGSVLSDSLLILLKLAKVVTGFYYDHFWVFRNYTVIARNLRELDAYVASNLDVNRADVFHIINVAPYARWLERRGVDINFTKGTPATGRRSRDKYRRSGEFVLAENGVFIKGERKIVSKLHKQIKAKFTYVSGATIGLGILPTKDYSGKNLLTLRKTKRYRTEKVGPYVYPAIEFRFPDGGK
jgi:hypothetical protein